jgi:hypothetical protein
VPPTTGRNVEQPAVDQPLWNRYDQKEVRSLELCGTTGGGVVRKGETGMFVRKVKERVTAERGKEEDAIKLSNQYKVKITK